MPENQGIRRNLFYLLRKRGVRIKKVDGRIEDSAKTDGNSNSDSRHIYLEQAFRLFEYRNDSNAYLAKISVRSAHHVYPGRGALFTTSVGRP